MMAGGIIAYLEELFRGALEKQQKTKSYLSKILGIRSAKNHDQLNLNNMVAALARLFFFIL